MQTEIQYKNSKGIMSDFTFEINKATDTHIWGIDLDVDKFRQLRIDRIIRSSKDLSDVASILQSKKLNLIISDLNHAELQRMKELLDERLK